MSGDLDTQRLAVAAVLAAAELMLGVT